jgi:uncharacterized protein YodC (DUF2158 family)
MEIGGERRLRAVGGVVAAGLIAAACVTTAAPPATTPTIEVAPTTRPAVVATARPVATSAPTPAPSVEPPESPGPPADSARAISRFLAEFAGEQPPFRVTANVEGTVKSGGPHVTISAYIEGNVSGQDFDGEVALPTARMKVRFVDGVGYARLPRGTWMIAHDVKQTQPLNPFSLLAPDDITYVDTVRVRGKRVHVLHTERWLGGALEAERIADIELLSTDFTIYVRDDGVPVRGVLDFSLEGTTSEGRGQFDYHVEYRFSRVGKPVTIEAPL